LKNETN
jgi:hypothetical protein